MGRHRRSAAGRAATGRATGVTQTYDTYAGGYAAADSGDYAGEGDYATEGDHLTAGDYLNGSPYATAGMYDSPGGIHETGDFYSKSDTYLFAADPATHATTGYAPDGGSGRGHRRRKKNVTPVRTGLLGVSAAVAMGAVAVASGMIPGSDSLSIGGGNADKVRAQDSPSDVQTQGGTDGTTDDREDSGTSRDLERSASPTVSPTKAPEKTETKTPSAKPSTKAPAKEEPKTEPTTKAPEKKAPEKAPSKSVSTASKAEAEVLSLVNEERAKAGCSPVTASSTLAALAESFSEDMAARGFFDHTDPSGASPWDRAEKLGIANLGGENIARGQADAAAVMEAWMNSPGHRANILNCDFKTLGVGAHFASGGPWWTQDFGY
ncbi:CAP domain-containing protein [Streptomyces phaeochromogenes]|uniref:CAP domain-containing protein n=1 Tax=Streptomyces phaeochromogenes TaxID=1923 RepID=A0ABZ1HB93_STRPH|nr:CAP domain-containing protein [Streptomyces phaeochromogenes]MCX5601126.1 CAP domain-containing protein [Streptomyces phaeochromogenes]WRZ29135.1 CAP domain-containing protein [Streptomyces phaeochromogenes]WSD14852.1 CAP domain-containing protein [Streptomyces phaeochromogenes]WSJ08304.1 CAP domain-containing protein [Streptomyces phaeochromogenes]